MLEDEGIELAPKELDNHVALESLQNLESENQAITYKLGEKVEVHFSGMWTGWFVGYIEEKNDDGTYAVVFEEGSRYNFIPPKRIREVKPVALQGCLIKTSAKRYSSVQASPTEKLPENRPVSEKKSSIKKKPRTPKANGQAQKPYAKGHTKPKTGSKVNIKTKKNKSDKGQAEVAEKSKLHKFCSKVRVKLKTENSEPDKSQARKSEKSKANKKCGKLDSRSVKPHPRTFQAGDVVKARWSSDGYWYMAKVVAATDEGLYDIVFNDGVEEKSVHPKHMRLDTKRAKNTNKEGSAGDGLDDISNASQVMTYAMGESVSVWFGNIWKGWYTGLVEEIFDDGCYGVLFEDGSFSRVRPQRMQKIREEEEKTDKVGVSASVSNDHAQELSGDIFQQTVTPISVTPDSGQSKMLEQTTNRERQADNSKAIRADIVKPRKPSATKKKQPITPLPNQADNSKATSADNVKPRKPSATKKKHPITPLSNQSTAPTDFVPEEKTVSAMVLKACARGRQEAAPSKTPSKTPDKFVPKHSIKETVACADPPLETDHQQAAEDKIVGEATEGAQMSTESKNIDFARNEELQEQQEIPFDIQEFEFDWDNSMESHGFDFDSTQSAAADSQFTIDSSGIERLDTKSTNEVSPAHTKDFFAQQESPHIADPASLNDDIDDSEQYETIEDGESTKADESRQQPLHETTNNKTQDGLHIADTASLNEKLDISEENDELEDEEPTTADEPRQQPLKETTNNKNQETQESIDAVTLNENISISEQDNGGKNEEPTELDEPIQQTPPATTSKKKKVAKHGVDAAIPEKKRNISEPNHEAENGQSTTTPQPEKQPTCTTTSKKKKKMSISEPNIKAENGEFTTQPNPEQQPTRTTSSKKNKANALSSEAPKKRGRPKSVLSTPITKPQNKDESLTTKIVLLPRVTASTSTSKKDLSSLREKRTKKRQRNDSALQPKEAKQSSAQEPTQDSLPGGVSFSQVSVLGARDEKETCHFERLRRWQEKEDESLSTATMEEWAAAKGLDFPFQGVVISSSGDDDRTVAPFSCEGAHKNQTIFNTCGPVWALHSFFKDSDCLWIAVGTASLHPESRASEPPSLNRFQSVGKPNSFPNIIQIWESTTECEAKFLFGVAHSYGTTWQLEWHPSMTDCLDGSPVSRCIDLISGVFGDGSVRLFSIVDWAGRGCVPIGCVAEKKPVCTLSLANTMLTCARWEPTSQTIIVTGASDGIICTWRISPDANQDGMLEAERLHSFVGNFVDNSNSGLYAVRGVAWCPVAPNLFAAVSANGKMAVWDTSVNAFEPLLVQSRFDLVAAVNVQWTPTGRAVVISYEDGTATVFDVFSQQKSYSRTLSGQASTWAIACGVMDLDHKKDFLATGHANGDCYLFEVSYKVEAKAVVVKSLASFVFSVLLGENLKSTSTDKMERKNDNIVYIHCKKEAQLSGLEWFTAGRQALTLACQPQNDCSVNKCKIVCGSYCGLVQLIQYS